MSTNITANICKGKVDNLHMCINVTGSLIAEHLIKSEQCACSYSPGIFSVLSRANSEYHLKVWKSVYSHL